MRQIDKNYLKNEGGVLCLICGAKLNYISNTHLKLHNLTNMQYKEKFPLTPTMSRKTLEKMSMNGKKHKNNFMKIIQKGKPNVSAFINSKRTIMLKKSLGLSNRSEESIKRQVDTLRKKVVSGEWYNPSSSLKAREKMSASAKERYLQRPKNKLGQFLAQPNKKRKSKT